MFVSEVFVCEGKIQTRGPLGGYLSVYARLEERVPFQALSELSANNYYRRIAQGEKNEELKCSLHFSLLLINPDLAASLLQAQGFHFHVHLIPD